MKIIKQIALLVLLTATSFRAMAEPLTFPPSLTNAIVSTVIGASTHDLVVLIYGWNHDRATMIGVTSRTLTGTTSSTIGKRTPIP